MDTYSIIIIATAVLMFVVAIFTIVDIARNDQYSSRIKLNLIFLTILIPFIGAIIYFFYLKKNTHSQKVS
ncbi:MAG: PLDc N-terminal domain-containing protein [Sphingobacteriales bacterium]|jgi:hypothetical protein|nr:PLDc N-terminal domain-containing protein [Sphingobacteriales bacterium]